MHGLLMSRSSLLRYTILPKISGSLFSTTKMTKFSAHTTKKYSNLVDNKEYTYAPLGTGDFDEVMDNVRDYFAPFEPIGMGLGASFEDRRELSEHFTRKYLKSGFCVGARNHTGKLIGFTLGENTIKGDSSSGKDISILAEGNKYIKHTLEIINHVEENYDVFSMQGVDEVMYGDIAMVKPEYQGQRLILNMYEIMEQKAIEKGIRIAYSIPTNIALKMNGIKLGYEIVHETPYKIFDFLDLSAMGDNKSISLGIKKLV